MSAVKHYVGIDARHLNIAPNLLTRFFGVSQPGMGSQPEMSQSLRCLLSLLTL